MHRHRRCRVCPIGSSHVKVPPSDGARDAFPQDTLPREALEPHTREALTEHLSVHLTQRRLQRMRTVLAQRTRRLTVVLEDIYQPHNASAVLRSCECFGIQDVHIIEDRNQYTISRDVALGASRWLDLHRWQATAAHTIDDCCDELTDRGYRLVAATPRQDAVPLEDFDVGAGPVAVMFGTELNGLTPAALERAKEAVHIPMHGFTESFNISVSAALILRELSARMRSSGLPWQLDDDDSRDLLLRWMRRSIKNSDHLIERFLAENAAGLAAGH
jgi:tRNA (guanosine-2'-O-)-methyltransferase